MDWLTTEEALAVLQTKPQTLYANVSRGRIRSKPLPDDPRRSLYRSEDVHRLAGKRPGRKRDSVVAADTIRWGLPIMRSGISTIWMAACSIAAATLLNCPKQQRWRKWLHCCGRWISTVSSAVTTNRP